MSRTGRSAQVRVTLLLAGAFGCGWLAVAAAFQILGLRFNHTPSFPVGLYRVAAGPASLIEFCPLGNAAIESAARQYRGRGRCADGFAPLLKEIVAREGDEVEFSILGMRVNGLRLENTHPLARDRHNRPMTHYPFGAYRVQAGSLWVASMWNDGSYDSRYFGPILSSQIRQRLTLWWTVP